MCFWGPLLLVLLAILDLRSKELWLKQPVYPPPARRAGGAGSWSGRASRRAASASCGVPLALVLLARLVGGEAVVERLQADAEHVGGLALRAALGERGLDQAAAHFVQRGADAHREQRRGFLLRHHGGRQVRIDQVVGEDEGALHVVLQLAHVARPAVRVERGDGGGREALG